MTFTVDHFVLTTGTGDNAMKATMNRYRPESYQRKDSDAGFILLFAHGTGFRISFVFRLFHDNILISLQIRSYGSPPLITFSNTIWKTKISLE